jgi:hypothetical protein
MRTGPQRWVLGDPLLAVDPAGQGTGSAGGADGGSHVHRQDDAPPTEDPALREGDKPPARSPEAVLGALAGLPVELERLIDGKSDDVLTQPAQDGGWGMVEILSHLRDWEEVFHGRLWAMLEEDRPQLVVHDDSLWAIERNYREQKPRQVFGRFRELRRTLTERVEGMDDAEWQRVGIHPRRGEITVHRLLDRLCDHDANHLEGARDVLG